MISIKDISHHYKYRTLVFRDWKISEGEQWLLLGDSGSGKSTLLHIIAGILHPKAGSVLIDNTNIYLMPPKKRDIFRGKHIGIVFQRPHLIKSLTIRENLVLAQVFARMPENRTRIQEVLDSLHISNEEDCYPHELSQGQLQRVSIARAVVNRPALLVADEPTSSLDDKNAGDVIALLKHQSIQNGSALVVATHDKRVKDIFSKHFLV